MAENINNNATKPTHTAYAVKREGRRLKFMRWLEVGVARHDQDTGVVQVFVDRLPVGGWNGFVYLAPIGKPPPSSDPQPQRPGEHDEDEE